ncbi:hypothetical protein [Aequorivita marina]|uniref:hypothetical protein n=1 Tax=Aequorivita marina TaxID=3073654 RepID=UPI0028762B11|nr:hypothetical protein [Aequorivita sp. S2608]MDS1299820.1 hypothetical protein [Aequorivita sp. S2608]
MRILILFLCFLFFSISFFSQEGYTDIKEFGLNGNVKSIESKYYSIKENQGKWILDTLNSQSKMYFNNNGGITKMVNQSFSQLETETIEIQRDQNGRKISYHKYNENGIFETGYYQWVDERKYQIKAKDSFGFRMESEFTLTKNFRDKSGITLYYDDRSGEHLLTHQYENILDQEGNLLSSKITYEPLHNSTTMIFEVQETDDFGNWIMVNLYKEEEEKESRQIMIRNIEYYK